MIEVATVVDDVRYHGKSGLSADVEFPAEFDPERTWRVSVELLSSAAG